MLYTNETLYAIQKDNNEKITIKSIQILRAIAALMVAYFHSTDRGGVNLLPHTGAFGVDIFFVISGFVIASMGYQDSKYFFIKRVFRILPLYIIATSIMIVICIIFPEKINRTVVNLPAFIKSILFIPYKMESNVSILQQGWTLNVPILQQGWSLNFEMFFYLIMAICIATVKNKKYLGIVCALTLSSIFTILNVINSDLFALKYYQKSLFPEFIYGIILFYIYTFLKGKNKEYLLIKNDIMNMIIFGIIGFVSFMYLVGDNFYKWSIMYSRNIFWGIPSLFLVFAFLNIERQIKNNCIINFFIKMGDASYVLYLFHTFIISFFTRLLFIKIIANSSNLIISVLVNIVVMASSIVGSIVIYNIIDKPIHKYLKNVFYRKIEKRQLQ